MHLRPGKCGFLVGVLSPSRSADHFPVIHCRTFNSKHFRTFWSDGGRPINSNNGKPREDDCRRLLQFCSPGKSRPVFGYRKFWRSYLVGKDFYDIATRPDTAWRWSGTLHSFFPIFFFWSASISIMSKTALGASIRVTEEPLNKTMAEISLDNQGPDDPKNGLTHGHIRQDSFVKLIARFLSARDKDQAKHAEDVLFDMFKSSETDLLSVGKFLAALKSTGIRKTDPRLSEFMDGLKEIRSHSHYDGSLETLKLDRDSFRKAISPNIVLISRAFRHQFVIPDFQGFCKYIEEFYWKIKPCTDGKVASYIPQLARMKPDSWGISVCTIDGQRFSVGDVTVPFTIQSCSKPLTYAIALENLGENVVHKYVGMEPSGRNFNELVLDDNKQPHNPMINAGAILVCALLKTLVKPEMTLAEKFDFTMNHFKKLAGNEPLGFNNAIFLSEREAADRNYALGFYMREHKCFPDKTNLKECMDFYFQCCSMEANCESMAVMAATLANGGICPITEEKVLRPDSVRNVLSLMHSCGMYDYSGKFAFKVGIPAKSGVSGAMLVVIPNVMGICTWSPPLDPLGNSCRGLLFCEELVTQFNFHRYDNLKHAANKKDPRRHKYETRGLSIVNLLFSAASGDVAAMRRHRLSGMDMTLSDYDGRTALHLAAAEGHLACVKFLIEQCDVPVDPRDRWGNIPVDEARTFGHDKVVEYFKTVKQLQADGKDNKSDESDTEKSGSEVETTEEQTNDSVLPKK